MNRKFCLLLTFVMFFSVFTGCSSSTASDDSPKAASEDSQATEAPEAPEVSEDEYKIVVSVASLEFVPVTYMMDGIKTYAAEHSNVTFQYLDAKNDAPAQLSQIQNAILEGANAIICLPVDATATQPIVKACEDANIPLIGMNRKFDGCNTFVGADALEGGKKQAEAILGMAGNKGKIAMMYGIMGQENQVKRTEGVMSVIDQYPECEVVMEGAADWKRDKALNLMENWLQSGTDFDILIANSDEMGIGASMALDKAGRTGEIMIASVDGLPDSLNLVKEGKIQVVMYQNLQKQGERAAETAVKYSSGETEEPIIYVEWEVVTKDNVQPFIDAYNAVKK